MHKKDLWQWQEELQPERQNKLRILSQRWKLLGQDSDLQLQLIDWHMNYFTNLSLNYVNIFIP